MTQLDLHPESLFDALRARRLSAGERARLEAHCAQCSACLFELRWLDTQLVAPRPNSEDRAYGEAAFDRVLRAAESARPKAPPSRSAPGALLRWGVGALLLGAGIGAALLAGRALWPNPSLPQVTRSQATSPSVAPGPSAAPPGMPMPTATPSFEASPSAARPGTPTATPSFEPASSAQPAPGELSGASEPSADALLAAARQASTSGKLRRATRLYKQVIRRFPASAAAGAARVALGRLLQSELGQPKAALALFDAYLRQHPDGALAQDALFYRALAFDSLGRPAESSAELRRLLQTYPHSMYVQSARARLAREPVP